MNVQRLRAMFDCAFNVDNHEKNLSGAIILSSSVGTDAFVDKNLSAKVRKVYLVLHLFRPF